MPLRDIINGRSYFCERNVRTVQVITFEGQQAIKLPPEFAICADSLAIRKEGDAIILEPIKSADWPAGFLKKSTSTIPRSLVPLRATCRQRSA